MMLENIDFKVLKSVPLGKKKTPKNICEISCDNKTIEKINLSRIFHNPLVKAALPNISARFDTFAVVCTLMNPI